MNQPPILISQSRNLTNFLERWRSSKAFVKFSPERVNWDSLPCLPSSFSILFISIICWTSWFRLWFCYNIECDGPVLYSQRRLSAMAAGNQWRGTGDDGNGPASGGRRAAWYGSAAVSHEDIWYGGWSKHKSHSFMEQRRSKLRCLGSAWVFHKPSAQLL